MNEQQANACERVEEHMSDVLDGSAPESLFDHLATCDRCRDARHAAESSREMLRRAAADYVATPKLTERVLAELDRRAGAAQATNGAAPPASAVLAEPAREEPATPAAPVLERATPNADAPRPLRAASSTARQGATRRKVVGVAAAAAAMGLGALWIAGGTSVESVTANGKGWRGKVQEIVTVTGGTNALQACAADGQSCRKLAADDSVQPGALLRTDARTRARLQLEDGTSITLDRDTELLLDASAPRRAFLRRGALLADVTHVQDRGAQIAIPLGHVAVLGTKLALRASAESASVDVSRGAVQLVDKSQRSVTVRAGEEGRIEGSSPPLVSPTLALGEVLTMSEAERAAGDAVLVRALGELKAKKPGQQQELAGAVHLSSHRVKVRIAGAVARTEVDEVFTNTTADVLEGIYRFPMPPDAQIERLALEVDGKLEEGAFVERDRAAAIWRGAIVNAAPSARKLVRDEIVWVPGPWKDPALLEWQRGGRFELRIFPIPKRGSRRVVLSYTQVLTPTAGVRRYSYPLAHDPSSSTKVADFSLDVQVVGHDAAFGVRSHGYELSRAGSAGAAAERLAFSARDFVPAGDLHVEYALPNRRSEVTAWGYRDAVRPEPPVARGPHAALAAPHEARSGGYVAIALRPELPRSTESEQRAFVLIVDTSRSLFGESYKRASALAVRTIAELDPGDRVSLLACDSDCRELPGGLRVPGTELAREAERFLGSIVPEGASDITRGLVRARSLAESSRGRSLRVVYIGDGSATVGPVRPSSVENAVRRAVPPELGTVTAVAVGADSDVDTLAALARGGGGALVPYVPGQSALRVAYTLLGATYGAALRDVHVELPPGLEQIAPQQTGSLLAGSETLVVARTERAQVDGDLVLRGRLGKAPFERRYPLKIQLSESKGNAFVPRLFAATRIVDLERDGAPLAKAEAVRLSKSFDVASRYTSLLVLESPAMFKAFGLDNQRHAPEFDAEELAVASESSSAETLAAAEDSSALDRAPLDAYADDARAPGMASGAGLSSLGRASSTAAPAAAPRPAPAPKSAAPRRSQAAPAELAETEKKRERRPLIVAEEQPWQPRGGPGMIPMRRIWQRTGQVFADRFTPRYATFTELQRVEGLHRNEPNRREHVKKLYVLSTVTGDLTRARSLAETWSSKEPLDPEALTARADLAAQAGDRSLAIRILGSVLDVRPYDGKARERLARLERWSGEPLRACRLHIANAELIPANASYLAEAVRCAREIGESALAGDILALADGKVRSAAEKLLAGRAADTGELSGDVRVEATWEGGADVDLALLDAEGHRISWLGAPTRAVISARDVESGGREALAVRGAAPGEYVLQVVRASGATTVRGQLTVVIAGTRRTLPFVLDGVRTNAGLVRISMESRLVPL
jgi:ferric-dicitrate binding protein FerR (iron transport regulator)